MKKCSYCGKEYPDEVTQCTIDGQPLSGGEVSLETGEGKAADLLPSAPDILPHAASRWGSQLTERQLRIIEITLVCAIAFGSGILGSFYYLLYPEIHAAPSGSSKWVYSVVRQGTVLALLWYILLRRSKGFSDTGFSKRWRKDIAWSIVLWIASGLAFRVIYSAIFYFRLTPLTQASSTSSISNYLFYGGITFATVVAHFVNPFFEEIIVRGYLMTEVTDLTKSSTKAVLLSTVLQTSYHFYQGIPAAVALGGMFLIFSIYFARTRRIVPLILAHLYADVGYVAWHLIRGYHH